MSSDARDGVGCLTILFVLLLIDVVGKAGIWGVMRFFGAELPPFPYGSTMLMSAFAIVGLPLIALILYILYILISEFAGKFFKRRKKTEVDSQHKDQPEQPQETI